MKKIKGYVPCEQLISATPASEREKPTAHRFKCMWNNFALLT